MAKDFVGFGEPARHGASRKGPPVQRLSAADRKAEPKSDFGLPAERKYPMPDKSHAANAKARATQQENAGNLSASSKAKIDAKADRILGEPKMSRKQDDALDKKSGIKEGSKADNKLDRERGLKPRK